MKNKDTIIILRSNPIKPDSRVEKEAYSLAKAGYIVEIVCWDRDSNHPVNCENLVLNEIVIPIHRFGYKASFGEGFKNIIPYLKFQFSMRHWIKTNKHRINAVHACDFDTAFFTHYLVLSSGIKFVFDIFDFLYGEPHNLFQYIIKKTQMSIIDKSDATIICTEERKQQIKGSNPKRLEVIHNTPAAAQVELNNNNNIIIPKNDRIKVCYVGILQNGRLLKEIGEVISSDSRFELHIGGFGYLESYFVDLSSRFDNIFFYGRLPYSSTLSLEKQCDVMLAIYDPSIENHRFAAPNKFYESLFLGKPLIMVKNTGMSSYIQKYGIGTLIDYNVDSFYSGLKAILSLKNDWADISNKMKVLYDNVFNWSVMNDRLVNMYRELLK